MITGIGTLIMYPDKQTQITSTYTYDNKSNKLSSKHSLHTYDKAIYKYIVISNNHNSI
jgi:hypothetical protein